MYLYCSSAYTHVCNDVTLLRVIYPLGFTGSVEAHTSAACRMASHPQKSQRCRASHVAVLVAVLIVAVASIWLGGLSAQNNLTIPPVIQLLPPLEICADAIRRSTGQPMQAPCVRLRKAGVFNVCVLCFAASEDVYQASSIQHLSHFAEPCLVDQPHYSEVKYILDRLGCTRWDYWRGE